MAKKQVILTGVEARTQLAKGAAFLADAVASTVGPFGQNFFTDKGQKITNDGVSVAHEIILNDEIQNLGASAIRESAIKTNDEAGDGTTTACILAAAIYKSASPFLGKVGVLASKKTPSEISRQIHEEKDKVISLLQAAATPIETKEQLINSAKVSVEDDFLGDLIGNAQWDLGKGGKLIAEETNETFSYYEKVPGIRLDNGFSTSMVVNNLEKHRLELSDIPVILTSYTINDFNSIKEILDQFIKAGHREIAIVARAWTEQGIKTCKQNFDNGIKIYPLNAPYTDMQQRFLDMQAVTGARFFDSEGSDLADMQLSDIGFAKKIRADRFTMDILATDDQATKDRIAKRAEEVRTKLNGKCSDFEKKMYEDRLAQLTNGFGIVFVGSASDLERKRLFDKCEDAVNAVRAAFEEGVVPGAGLAFKTISNSLPDDYLLKKPLLALYEQIMSSAPADFVIEDWVMDPVKVLRCALKNACAAAATLATAGGAIAQKNPSDLESLFKKAE